MWLTQSELNRLGFASVGDDVLIDRRAALINPSLCKIGDGARVDAFALLSPGEGHIEVGRNVHISAGATIFGSGGVTIRDFATVSVGVNIFSVSDDFSDGFLSNPTVPMEFRKIKLSPVTIEKYGLVGSNSVLLPGVTVGYGASVGALTLVTRSIPDHEIWAGSPAKKVGVRNREVFLSLVSEYENGQKHQ